MTIYTPTARFDTGRALTEDELRAKAPSIFAVQAHESRSERFVPIPTIEVIRGLANEGFFPVGVQQSGCRQLDRKGFTKHLIRIRRLDDEAKYKVGDTVFELLLKNANDGSCQYDLMAGLFRIACMNSLVSQISSVGEVKVRHSRKDAVGEVIDATYKIVKESDKVLAAAQDWQQLRLAPPEKQAFAEAAHVLRFADSDGNVNTPIKADQLLIPRRGQDQGNDLWKTFNVVQENAIKGGLVGYRERQPGERRPRRASTRQINGIDQSVGLNKALWVLAEKLAEHKRAA